MPARAEGILSGHGSSYASAAPGASARRFASPFLAAFSAWASAGIPACLLRAEPYLDADAHELDVLIPPASLKPALRVLANLGWEVLDSGFFEPSRRHLLLWWQGSFLKLDLYTVLLGGGLAYLDAARYFADASSQDDICVPCSGAWLLHVVLNTILEKQSLAAKYRPRMAAAVSGGTAVRQARSAAGQLGLAWLFDQEPGFDFLFDAQRLAALRPMVRAALLRRRPVNRLRLAWQRVAQKCGKTLGLRPGFSIAVIGPDGAGKTTFLSTLERALNSHGINTGRAYMGPWEHPVLTTSRMLRRLGADPLDIGPAAPARASFSKLMKAHARRLLYYANFLPEMWARHGARVRDHVQARHVVLLDRHAIDLQVGYYNAPMSNTAWLRALLVRLSPWPRLFILLDNDAHVIWARKAEFPLPLIEAALARYHTVARRHGMTVVRTDRPPEQLVQALLEQRWRDFVRWRRDGFGAWHRP